jgi:hypothetical protein
VNISGKVVVLTGGGSGDRSRTTEAQFARGTEGQGQHRLLGADRAYHLLTRIL